MSSINRNALLAQFNNRWLGAGLAAAGAVVAADQANAAIVYTAPVGGINVPSSFGGVYVNMENAASGPTNAVAGWDINPYGTTYLSHFTPTGGGIKGTLTSYQNLAPGNQICSTDLFDTGTSTVNDPAFPINLNSSNNLFGVRLALADLSVHMGWFRMQLGAANGGVQPRFIVDWAFESTNACIAAGAVPEPGSLALLAAGAIGLVARRRRQS